jgi:hypothetical protein
MATPAKTFPFHPPNSHGDIYNGGAIIWEIDWSVYIPQAARFKKISYLSKYLKHFPGFFYL